MSDWSPSEDGGSIWTDGDVQELIDDEKRDGESPNQFLHRVLEDEPQGTSGGPQVEEKVKKALKNYEGQIRDLARQEAEEVFEEKRREYS